MNRVTAAFEKAHAEKRTAIMPYITAGDPPRPGLGALVQALDQAGSDVIEIGIPFSDPIADGPVIASAMHRALDQGTTPEGVLEEVRAVRSEVQAALVFMVSVSIVAHVGVEQFVSQAAAAGVDGLIVPDADLDDLTELADSCATSKLALIPLVAPTSSPERQQEIVRHATGFIYLLARAGVTGVRRDAPDIADRIAALREFSSLPIGVGFGISTHAHVQAVGRHADGAIVGSGLVQALHDAHTSGADVATTAVRFVTELKG